VFTLLGWVSTSKNRRLLFHVKKSSEFSLFHFRIIYVFCPPPPFHGSNLVRLDYEPVVSILFLSHLFVLCDAVHWFPPCAPALPTPPYSDRPRFEINTVFGLGWFCPGVKSHGSLCIPYRHTPHPNCAHSPNFLKPALLCLKSGPSVLLFPWFTYPPPQTPRDKYTLKIFADPLYAGDSSPFSR